MNIRYERRIQNFKFTVWRFSKSGWLYIEVVGFSFSLLNTLRASRSNMPHFSNLWQLITFELPSAIWHHDSYKDGYALHFNSIWRPSEAKVLLPPIFSNLHILGTDKDTTKEHEMNSLDICPIHLTNRMLFFVSLSVFKLERFETIWGSNAFASASKQSQKYWTLLLFQVSVT